MDDPSDQYPLRLRGSTIGDYFHVLCEQCATNVSLSDLRWVGGVPEIRAACHNCGQQSNFKLEFNTWADALEFIRRRET